MTTENEYIKAASLFTENRKHLPLLGAVALNASIRATDLETFYHADIAPSVHGLLYQNQVKGYLSGATVPLDTNDLKYYPETPGIGFSDVTAEIPAETLVALFKRAIQTASKDATRYNLNGIFLDIDSLVTTDGHRLTVLTCEAMQAVGQQVIVPTDAALKVIKWLSSRKRATVTVSLGHSAGLNYIRFSIGIESVSCRLIDGQFPDYRQVIPTSHNREYYLPIESLRLAFETRIKPLLGTRKSSEMHSCKLTFNGGNGGILSVYYRNPDSKAVIETALKCAESTSDPLDSYTLGLNPWYVLDFLAGPNKHHSAPVTMKLTTEIPGKVNKDGQPIPQTDVVAPVVLTYCDTETTVIMPVRMV